VAGITGIGMVALRSADAIRLARFYQERLGLRVVGGSANLIDLGVDDGAPLLRIKTVAGASPRPPHTSGLYHFALLLPDRTHLARAFLRLVETNTPLQGASDHLVSEAIYLADPDGNGIEIYADRPRDRWPSRNGKLTMATEPLDLRDLVGTLGGVREPWTGLPAGSRIGHIHLHVALLRDAERFYCERLGFDLVMRYGPSALFVSVDGYHHHVGLNTWAGVGASPPPPDASGLHYYTIEYANEQALREAVVALRNAGVAGTDGDARVWTQDPSEIRIALSLRWRSS